MTTPDIVRAQALLRSGGYTCVLCRGDAVYTSTRRGVAPLVAWIDSGADLRGFSAADKIVGQAAALLLVLMGVSAVYAPVMSAAAAATLALHGIRCSFDTLTAGIINRAGAGPCPMEQAVGDLQDPAAALEAIRRAQARLSAPNGPTA